MMVTCQKFIKTHSPFKLYINSNKNIIEQKYKSNLGKNVNNSAYQYMNSVITNYCNKTIMRKKNNLNWDMFIIIIRNIIETTFIPII